MGPGKGDLVNLWDSNEMGGGGTTNLDAPNVVTSLKIMMLRANKRLSS